MLTTKTKRAPARAKTSPSIAGSPALIPGLLNTPVRDRPDVPGVQMRICIHTGTGTGPTPLAAFDAALLDAGVCNYNLLCLSSVIPPQSAIERARYEACTDEYGHRLYVVMAHRGEQAPGREAWAGLGWTQDPADGRGLFVELKGESRDEVETSINRTLEAMIASRPQAFGPINHEIVGVRCEDQPVCALVIAVYESQGWDSN